MNGPALHEPEYLEPWQYYACEQPERPHSDMLTAYDLRCQACRIAAKATLTVVGDLRGVWRETSVVSDDRIMRLSEALELAESRHVR